MPNALIGRYASVKLGSAVIANLASWKMDFTTDELDASVFGTGWGATMPGQQKWVATVDGFLDMLDTTGQLVIKTAKFAGTKVTNIKFFDDTTSGWVPDITTDSSAGAYILGMSIDAAMNGLVKVSYKIGGVGPIALV
jgi:hypothetical protein